MGCFSARNIFKSVRRRSLAQSNTRTIPLGKIQSESAQRFPNNRVVTSKYTIWNFLPKNLFGQFRRIANFYFLCIAVVQLSINSPISPATSLTPLIFVVVVTAIKQAYEDWLRHKADNQVNMQLVRVVKDGKLEKIQSQDIKVGDIVMVKAEEEFPCDLVLLSSSDPIGRCFITTANLDGETNLKTHESLRETRHLQGMQELSNLNATIECQQPNPDLYRFLGRMNVSYEGQPPCIRSLGPSNLLLKGARLKNTAFIYGCAVYTGEQTKMVLNLRLTSNKFSTVEKSMNHFLVVFLVLLLVESSVATALQYAFMNNDIYGIPWYLPPPDKVTPMGVFADFLSFVVLFNYIIPISLYVSLEMVKFIGAMFFAWDEQLYDAESGECARCNTSDLNEELGQVEYLFTDKTGTLTENDMQFRQCSIDGLRYTEHGGMLCRQPDTLHTQPDPILSYTEEQEDFLLCMAICNTIQVERKVRGVPASAWVNGHAPSPYPGANGDTHPVNGGLVLPPPVEPDEQLIYQASSPDEKALVEACSRFGVVLSDFHDDTYEVLFKGKLRTYRRLHVLEFDSDRKRMSVVVQDEEGEIRLLCKGAENSVLQNSVSGPKDITLQHVDGYALAGLRTLVFAYKKMSQKDYEHFNQALHYARSSMVDREEAVSKVFESAEQGLVVLGATAVEDRLQDGVPHTLEALRAAGIKIWVLTGDKHETAINISVSCGHIKRGMIQLSLVKQSTVQECLCTLQQLHNRLSSEPLAHYALVVDGVSLSFALSQHKELLSEVARSCQAVLCCRMSPLQKAQVVTMIKNHSSRPITAAIGDGANDVSMIQEAHVGLGVMGKEGRQAVRCADFAFARFKFLQRVLLVHGHYYYVRVATLVQYFFYKNIAFITPQVIYTFYTAFSSQPLYHSVYLMFFNLFFTSLPILVYGLSEQNLPQRTLIENPDLYKYNAGNALLTTSQFIKWLMQGLLHALVAFFGVFIFFSDNRPFLFEGQVLDLFSYGTIIYKVIVFVVNLKLMLQMRYLTGPFVASIAISVLGFEAFSFLYSSFMWPLQDNQMYKVFIIISSSASFWFLCILLIVVSLLPDLIVLMIQNNVAKIGRILKNVKSSCLKSSSMVPLSLLYSSRPPDVTVFHITVNPERTL